MTINDLKESMDMDMEITFVYQGKEYFLEPVENSDKWMLFFEKVDDPEYLTRNQVLNLNIDGKPISEILPLCSYVNY